MAENNRQIYMQAPVDGWYSLYNWGVIQFQAATGAACIFVLYPSSINFEDLKQREKALVLYFYYVRCVL